MHSRDVVKSQIYTYIFRSILNPFRFKYSDTWWMKQAKLSFLVGKISDQRINDFRVSECPGSVNALHPKDSEAGLQEDMVIGTPGWLDHKEVVGNHKEITKLHEHALMAEKTSIRICSVFLSRCDQERFVWGHQMKSLDEADVDQDPANGRGFWRAASKVT